MIGHNGEINTLRGNLNWMHARHQALSSVLFGDDLEKIWPLIDEGQSDSACFDNALELLVLGGYSPAHAMMLLIPEAWAGNPLMDEKRRAFYEFYAPVMEPWDGPAAVAFTDGRQIGATLDRNGLTAPGALRGYQGRPCHHGFGGRCSTGCRGKHCPEMALAAGQDVAHRYRAAAHHRRRGNQGKTFLVGRFRQFHRALARQTCQARNSGTRAAKA
jgi:hypothetical protein